MEFKNGDYVIVDTDYFGGFEPWEFGVVFESEIRGGCRVTTINNDGNAETLFYFYSEIAKVAE